MLSSYACVIFMYYFHIIVINFMHYLRVTAPYSMARTLIYIYLPEPFLFYYIFQFIVFT